MRVLFIDECIAFPLDSGKKLRTHQLLKEASKTHNITCIAYADSKEDQNAIDYYETLGVRIIPVTLPKINKIGLPMLISVGINTFQAYPFSVAAYNTRQIRTAIKKELNSHKYDLFHCELTQLSQLVSLSDNIPSVLNAHNIEAIIWQRLANTTSNPLKKLGYSIQARKMERFERYYSSQYRLVIYTTENDRRLARKRYNIKHAEVVENGVDIEHFNFDKKNAPNREILFVGAMDWRPMQDGVVYFIEEILPHIWKLDRGISFTAVGRRVPTWLKERFCGYKKIRIISDVEDIRDYYHNCCAVVVPLRVGSGSRLKILEAFAMGRPVVSTSIGAEGLNIENGHHLIIRDTPHEFASALISMINNPDQVKNLIHNSRQYVVKNHNCKQLGQKFSELWLSMAPHT